MAILVLSTLTFVLRLTNILENVGDNMNYALRAIPTYSIAQSLYFETSGELLSEFRERTRGEGADIEASQWGQLNNLLDVEV